MIKQKHQNGPGPGGNNDIPGTIEAENYSSMSGIQKETCSEGGQNVGYLDAVIG